MGLCQVGIESFTNTFEYYFCEHSRLLSRENSVDLSNPNWVAYNETLAAAAETCKKVCTVSVHFIECVTETFCNTATDAVKEMGRQVYLINQETNQAAAAALLPWAVGITVAGLGIAKLTEVYAPKGRLSTGVSVAGNVIGTFGGIGLLHCGRTYFNAFA